MPTAINQLWVSDITYVRLGRVDTFLAVVMDALTALRNAIESQQPAPGRFIIPIAVCNTRLPLTSTCCFSTA